MQDTIDRLAGRRTIIVVAHRLASVRNADRIVVVEGGRIVESGPPRLLLQTPSRCRQLFASQLAAGGSRRMSKAAPRARAGRAGGRAHHRGRRRSTRAGATRSTSSGTMPPGARCAASCSRSRRRREWEARALGRLAHPGIVRLLEDGAPRYMLTEFLEGPSLRKLLRSRPEGPAGRLRRAADRDPSRLGPGAPARARLPAPRRQARQRHRHPPPAGPVRPRLRAPRQRPQAALAPGDRRLHGARAVPRRRPDARPATSTAWA